VARLCGRAAGARVGDGWTGFSDTTELEPIYREALEAAGAG
jgi:hypothetical protein